VDFLEGLRGGDRVAQDVGVCILEFLQGSIGGVSMAQDIAVCIDGKGVTSSLYDGSTLVIYQKKQGLWQVSREKAISLDKQGGMAGLRRQMAEVILFLGECRIFVGQAVVGVPYFELEKMQCSIWEFEGTPSTFLDYVLAQEENKLANVQPKGGSMMPELVERENGDFYISIKEVQENGSGMTSKQVLMPILQQGKFYSLEIHCNHVPPWLEVELQDGRLIGRVEKIAPMEVHIYITKRGCE